jgi:glycosyltransferase involved in cell wall biosynthesis
MENNNKNNFPLVSVAFPIFNEEKFITESIESILNQDYPKLEIIICDNASTDNTGRICEKFANMNSRISYLRQNNNIGAVKNFSFGLSKAKGKYFMWAAGHDKWSPNLITQCVQLLERSPSTTIAFGTPKWIGQDGVELEKHSGWYDTRGLNPVVRFIMTLWGSVNPILGVIRRDCLPDLNKNYNLVGIDLVLLADLALKGEFVHATNAIFYRRQNRPAENYRDKLNRYKSRNTKISNTLFSKLFPLAKLPFALIRTVVQSDIGLLDKIFIMILLFPFLPIKYVLGKRDNKQTK